MHGSLGNSRMHGSLGNSKNPVFFAYCAPCLLYAGMPYAVTPLCVVLAAVPVWLYAIMPLCRHAIVLAALPVRLDMDAVRVHTPCIR
jgi:hypothetical protein